MEVDSSQLSQQSPIPQLSSSQHFEEGYDFFRDIEIESFSVNNDFDIQKSKDIFSEVKRAQSSVGSLEADALNHFNRLRDEALEQDALFQELARKSNENERLLVTFGKERDVSEERHEKAKKTKPVIQYEAQRIRTIHEDLNQQANAITALNEDIVGPVLEKKRMEHNMTMEDISKTNKELVKANDLMKELRQQYLELESNHDCELNLLQERKSMESNLRSLPQELQKGIEVMHKKRKHLHDETARGKEQVCVIETKTAQVNDFRMKVERIKKDFVAKLDEGKRKFDRSQDECDSISKALVLAQTKFNSVATNRVQIEIKLSETTEDVRHENAAASLQRKQLDRMMRLYVKKKGIVDRSKNTVEGLLVQLENDQHIINTKRAIYGDQSKSIEAMKDEVNIKMTRLFEKRNIEDEVKVDIENLLSAIEQSEGEVDRWRTEVKKLSKITSVLNNQRDIQMGRTKAIASEGKETLEVVKLKTFVVLDMQKVLRETNTRTKELRALYESMRRQKSEVVAAISASSQTLAEVRRRIDSSTVQSQALQRAQEEKMNVLIKELDAHENSKVSNRVLRVEHTKAKSKLRENQEENEREGGNIDRLKTILATLQRDIIHQKTRNRLLANRNRLMSEQLSDKKIEVHSLLKRENLQEEIIKRGKLAMQQKREDIRDVRIRCIDAERFLNSRMSLESDIRVKAERIDELKVQLQDEANQLNVLSECIESPTKTREMGRWRDLGGGDLDNEQLYAKTQILIDRLGENKEQIVEREVILEHLQSQTQLLAREADLIKVNVQPSIKQLNDCQSRVREVTRSMMALISELSMYQATALKLEEEKEAKQDSLTNYRALAASGQPPSLNALKALNRLEQRQRDAETSMCDSSDFDPKTYQNEFGKLYYPAKYALRTTAEPRPSAYIPDCGLELPTPYGRMAPFKPCEYRSSALRHITHAVN